MAAEEERKEKAKAEAKKNLESKAGTAADMPDAVCSSMGLMVCSWRRQGSRREAQEAGQGRHRSRRRLGVCCRSL